MSCKISKTYEFITGLWVSNPDYAPQTFQCLISLAKWGGISLRIHRNVLKVDQVAWLWSNPSILREVSGT